MIKETMLAMWIAFAIVACLGPFVIPALRRLKIGQTERKVLNHDSKNGTPTMGGIMILIAIFVASVFFAGKCPRIIPVLVLTLGFGLICFLDDFLKVVLRRPDGLRAWQKMLLEILVTTEFTGYLLFFSDISLLIRIPFSGAMIDIGWVAIPILYIAVIGTVNGVNFTDGLDGLSSSVTIPVALFFAVASIFLGAQVEVAAGAVAGALMGFLLFNAYPAKVFMGDTGSLALGGFVAGIAYTMNLPIFIAIVGGLYLIEVLSVILQVSYFKISHGKRIFRMAPIHHHFEKGGWSETRVVAVFMVITVLLCTVGLLGIVW